MQEATLRKKIRRSKIQSAVLNSLYMTGMVAMAVLAPNVLSILKAFKGKEKNQKYRINAAVQRMHDKGLVTWEQTKRGVFLRLTEEGKRFVELFGQGILKHSVPKKWDGRWRIVIFDIHETRRGTRNHFRQVLSEIGFVKLQNSVWVYPYDCEEVLVLLKANFRIGKDILYIIADSIENDRWLKAHFCLV